MKNRQTYHLLVLIILFSFSSCSIVKGIKLRNKFDSGTVKNTQFQEEIAFEYTGHINITALINGVEKRFIVDTGAGINVISKELQEELGLSSNFEYEIGDGIDTYNTEWIKIKKLEIGSVLIENSYTVVQDFEVISDFYCEKFDGIIGSNVLSKMNVKIDYHHKKLVLTNLKGNASSIERIHDFEFSFVNGLGNVPKVTIHSNNNQLKATLDTGFPYVMLNDTYIDSIAVPYSYIQGKTQRRITGNSLDTIMLYKDVPLRIGTSFDLKVPEIMGSKTVGGVLIGNSLLYDYTVYIDNDVRKVYLDKVKTTKEVADEKSYKFGIEYKDGEILFSYFFKGSKLSGVPIDSKIVSVNSKSLETPTLDDYCEFNTMLLDSKQPLVLEIFNSEKNVVETYKIKREPF